MVLLFFDPPGKAELLSTWFDSKQLRDIVELPQTCHTRPEFCSIAFRAREVERQCWILIRMVEWNRLVSSHFSFG